MSKANQHRSTSSVAPVKATLDRRARALARLLPVLVPALFPALAGAQVVGGPGPAKPQRPASQSDSQAVPQIAVTATLATDYVSRGVSQTGGRPQVSAGAEFGLAGIYAGATAFHVDFRNRGNPKTRAEIDLYSGYVTQLLGQNLDLGVIRYGYTPQPSGQPGLDYTELYAKTARALGPVTLAGSVYYSPNGMSDAGVSWYGVVSGAWQINPEWAVSALAGRQTMRSGGNYDDWNTGVTYALNKAVALDLRYWNTSRHGLGADYRQRVVLSTNLSF